MGKSNIPLYIGTPDYIDGDKMVDFKTGKYKRIIWKKKVYGPDIAISQEKVDGDPTTMPNIYEWYAYGNNRIVNVIRMVNYFALRLGKNTDPIGPTRAIFFRTTKETTVNTAKEAVELAEKWLFE